MCEFKFVGDLLMSDKLLKFFVIAAACFLLLPTCASGGSNGASGDDGSGEATGASGEADQGTTDEGTADQSATGGDDGATTVYVSPERGEGCNYDIGNKGKIVGKHIKDFGLKQVFGPTKADTDAYWLHANCGQKKAIWIILATGW